MLNQCSPLAVPGLLILDQVKGLDGAEAAEQLTTLLLVQVVGQPTNEDALALVCARHLRAQGLSVSKCFKNQATAEVGWPQTGEPGTCRSCS